MKKDNMIKIPVEAKTALILYSILDVKENIKIVIIKI